MGKEGKGILGREIAHAKTERQEKIGMFEEL